MITKEKDRKDKTKTKENIMNRRKRKGKVKRVPDVEDCEGNREVLNALIIFIFRVRC